MSNGDCDAQSLAVGSCRLGKRSRALRGRNLARDIQASDAPTARGSDPIRQVRADFPSPLDIGVMPQKILPASPSDPQNALPENRKTPTNRTTADTHVHP